MLSFTPTRNKCHLMEALSGVAPDKASTSFTPLHRGEVHGVLLLQQAGVDKASIR